MSLELDWLYQLSDPLFTLGLATPIIGISSLAAFLVIRTAVDVPKWRNRISFAAEVLVIFGIVGIFAFVGKARNDMLTIKSTIEVKEAEYAFSVETNRLKRQICDETIVDNRNTAAAKLACERLAVAQEMFSHDSSLAFLARDYQRISEIPNLNSKEVLLLTRASRATFEFLDATNNKALHEARLREAGTRGSWHLVLVIAAFVAIGVGCKCGRAAADLWPGKR